MAQVILLCVILVVLYTVAIISKAVMDTVDFHFERSIFMSLDRKVRMWWNQSEGWKNKYKDRDPSKGRAFPGSLTWLVWVTDAWHFFQMIMLTSYELMFIMPIIILFPLPWWVVFPCLFVAKLYRGGVFELFWKHIFKLK